MQKEKEELDDITMELELADEDDKIPSVPKPPHMSPSFVPDPAVTHRYKIGDSFFHVTVSQAQGML